MFCAAVIGTLVQARPASPTLSTAEPLYISIQNPWEGSSPRIFRMSSMLHPETNPFAVIDAGWPMFSGLSLTGVTTTPGLVAGLKSLGTKPVNSIGAALAAGECSPSRISNATFHVYKRRGTMTRPLPRMVSSSRGCRPRHDVYVCRDDLARKSGDQRVASDRHAA